jgi:hypothetical protein
MRYNITERTIDIQASTTIVPEERYGGWFAANQGNTNVTVMGYTIVPGKGMDMRDAVPAGSVWGSPIQIVIPAGGLVRLTRLQYNEIKK